MCLAFCLHAENEFLTIQIQITFTSLGRCTMEEFLPLSISIFLSAAYSHSCNLFKRNTMGFKPPKSIAKITRGLGPSRSTQLSRGTRMQWTIIFFFTLLHATSGCLKLRMDRLLIRFTSQTYLICNGVVDGGSGGSVSLLKL